MSTLLLGVSFSASPSRRAQCLRQQPLQPTQLGDPSPSDLGLAKAPFRYCDPCSRHSQTSMWSPAGRAALALAASSLSLAPRGPRSLGRGAPWKMDTQNSLPWGAGLLRRLASCRRRQWGGPWHSVQKPSWGTLEKAQLPLGRPQLKPCASTYAETDASSPYPEPQNFLSGLGASLSQGLGTMIPLLLGERD